MQECLGGRDHAVKIELGVQAARRFGDERGGECGVALEAFDGGSQGACVADRNEQARKIPT